MDTIQSEAPYVLGYIAFAIALGVLAVAMVIAFDPVYRARRIRNRAIRATRRAATR